MPKKQKAKNNILITSAGSQNGVNVIKALKGHNLVAGDFSDLSAGLYLVKKRYTLPKAKDGNFTSSVMIICHHEKIDIIIPTYSEEILVLSEYVKPLCELGIKMALSAPETYVRTENKVDCNAELEAIGVDVPKIYKDDIKYPAIIKPVKSSGTKRTYKLENEADYNYHKAEGSFVSEFVEGDEFTVGGISDLEGKFIACIPCKRTKVNGGLSVQAQTIKDKKLEATAKKIAEHFKMVGAWNVQFKGGKCIDVNNRFPSGTMPLLVASGLNQADIIVKLLNGEKPKLKIKYGLKMMRYYSSVIIDKDYKII